MKIYWSPRTRAFSTIWAMEETGMPYERVELDTANNAHKTPEFLAINPMGKVPAMSDGDAAMSEGAAIIAYIAERYPDAKLAPEVGDHKRARYLQWLFFGPTCIEPAIMQAYLKFEVPSSTAAWGSTQQVFDVLEAAVEKGPYLLGDDFSAADIVIGSGINFAVRLFKLIPTRPAFDRYVDTLAARPAFQRAEKIAAG